jgi:hypothetical protein
MMYYSLVLATNEVVNTPQLVCSRLYRAHNLSCTVYTERVYVCTQTCLQAALYTPRALYAGTLCIRSAYSVCRLHLLIYCVRHTYAARPHHTPAPRDSPPETGFAEAWQFNPMVNSLPCLHLKPAVARKYGYFAQQRTVDEVRHSVHKTSMPRGLHDVI